MAQSAMTFMSGETKEELQDVLSELEFVENESDLKKFRCEKCKQIALTHYLANCKHLFCKGCFDKILLEHCPVQSCSNRLIVQGNQDAKFEVSLNKLRVRCLRHTCGCEEILPLHKLMDHQSQCLYSTDRLLPKMWQPKPAAKSFNAEKLQEEFHELRTAVKNMHTKICGLEREFSLKQSETEKFIKKINDNLKDQMESIKRDMIMEICSNLSLKLERNEIVLEDKLMDKIKQQNIDTSIKNAKDIEDHVTKQKEELSRIINMKCKEGKRYSNFRALESSPLCDVVLEERKISFLWKVTQFHEMLKKWKQERKGAIISEVLFDDNNLGIKMRAKLEFMNEKWLGLSVDFNQDEDISPVHYHRRKFILFDQCQIKGINRDIIRILEPPFDPQMASIWTGSFTWCTDFAPIKLLEQGAPYVVDDTILVQILIEPLSIIWKSVTSTDGTLTWDIVNYSKKKKYSQDGVMGHLHSSYFYSSPKGYLMKCTCNFYSATHLTLSIHFLKGEWDDSLSSVFPHRISVSVLNRFNSLYETFSQNECDSFSCVVATIPYSKIENGSYFINDQILIRIAVEPIKR